MDWAKAKTILIIAFVITNIFLAYNVWNTKYYGHRSERIRDDRIEELVDILQQRGMRVSAPIPKDLYTEILTVEYMEIDTDGLMETVFEGKELIPLFKGIR